MPRSGKKNGILYALYIKGNKKRLVRWGTASYSRWGQKPETFSNSFHWRMGGERPRGTLRIKEADKRLTDNSRDRVNIASRSELLTVVGILSRFLPRPTGHLTLDLVDVKPQPLHHLLADLMTSRQIEAFEAQRPRVTRRVGWDRM
jgi:hypothetical protein